MNHFSQNIEPNMNKGSDPETVRKLSLCKLQRLPHNKIKSKRGSSKIYKNNDRKTQHARHTVNRATSSIYIVMKL
jgi:hypothetical protein